MDDHICGDTSFGKSKKSKQSTHTINREMVLFTCGHCLSKFKNICALHNHLFDHKEGGSYSYDNITKTAFPKYDSTCAYTQVNEDLLSLVDHRNESNMIDCGNASKETQTPLKKNNTVRSVRQSKRIAEHNITYATAGKSTRIVRKNTDRTSAMKCDENNLNAKETTQAEKGSVTDGNEIDRFEIDHIDSDSSHTKTIEGKRKRKSVMISNNIGENIPGTAQTRIDTDTVKNVSEDRTCENDSKISTNQQHDEITASEALIAIGKTTDKERTSKSRKTNKISEKDSAGFVNENHSVETDPQKCMVERKKDNVDCLHNDDKDKEEFTDLKRETQTKTQCPTCGKLGSRAMKSYHRYLHKEHKELSCDKCGRTFQHPSCLKLHMRSHGEKTFTCDLCPQKFHRKQYLEIHMCKHTGEKPYMCELCGKAYRDAMHLKRHIRHVHEKIRNFECDICKEKFFRSDHLKSHRQRHFEPGLKCKYCPRKFKLPMDLERHTYRHTGENRWFCHLCTGNQGFKYPLPYYNHMMKNHGIEREEASVFRKLLIEKEKLKKGTHTTQQVAKEQNTVETKAKHTITETDIQGGSTAMDKSAKTDPVNVNGLKILEVKRYTSTIGKNYKRDVSRIPGNSNKNNGNDEDIISDVNVTELNDDSEKSRTSPQPVEVFYAHNAFTDVSNTDQILKFIDQQSYDNRGVVNTELDGDTNYQGLHIVSMEETVTADLGMMPELDGEDMQAVMFIDDNDCTAEVVIDQVSTL